MIGIQITAKLREPFFKIVIVKMINFYSFKKLPLSTDGRA